MVHMARKSKHIGILMTATIMLPSFVWAAPDWQSIPPVVSSIPLVPMTASQDMLTNTEVDTDVNVIDETALMADVDLFTDVLNAAVEREAWQMVAELLPLYASLDHHDHTLYHFASARLYQRTDIAKSIDHYEQALITADLTPIKVQLILAYLMAGQILSAIELMDEVLTDKDLPKLLHDQLIAQHKQLTSPKLSIGSRYLADENVNQAPTRTQWGDWQLSPAQSAHGIGYDIDVRQSFYPKDHYRIVPAVRVLTKQYWDNSAYNDRVYELGVAISHQQVGREITVLPYHQQRYFGGDAYGTRTGVRTQVNFRYPNTLWQLGAGYAVKRHNERQYLDGDSYELTSMIVRNRPAHDIQLVGQLIQDNTKYPTDSYSGYLTSIGVDHQLGQWGVSYQLGLGARRYKDKDIFGIWRRDRLYSVTGSVWHQKLAYRGYLPRLNYQFERRDSTHFAYDTRSSAVFVDVQKRF